MTNREFKKNLDSITENDIIQMRNVKVNHPIKLEDLNMSLKLGNEYELVIREFLEALGFQDERIESCECRRRDGFIPYSHNKGGLSGYSYQSQSIHESTGFNKVDEVIEKGRKYNEEYFRSDNNIDKDAELTEYQLELLYEYEQNSDDTIQFQARVLMTSETTANVDFYISASDSPYHRSSDEKLELSIKFKTSKGMKRKLNAILKKDFVQNFKANVQEGF
jgi:hypothetical protein